MPAQFGTCISLTMLRPARCCPWTITAPFRRRPALAMAKNVYSLCLGPSTLSAQCPVSWNSLPTEFQHHNLTLGIYVTYSLTVHVEMSVFYLLTYSA